MKRYVILVLMVCSFSLSACFHSSLISTTQYSQENWGRNLHNKIYTKDASSWFFRDERSDSDRFLEDSINFITIPVYDFNKIHINGNFNVQIKGNVKQNYVMVQGPANITKFIKIQTIGETLYLEQRLASSLFDKVIIRIGVRYLKDLTHQGHAAVEGTGMYSRGLTINSTGAGDIYLKGNLILNRIIKQGDGSIGILNAKSYQLDILATDDSEIGISGRLGLRSIVAHGNSEVNIMGAVEGNLHIVANQNSQIAIGGQANVKDIQLKDQAAVYINEVNSHYLHIQAHNQSQIGLRGKVTNLFVEMAGASKFYGKYLLTKHAFVRTQNQAHANVMALSKLYATANDSSSIYFFGPENILFSSTHHEGIVLPINDDNVFESRSTLKPFLMQ